MSAAVLIEGYAARTDQIDLEGDLVCPGAIRLGASPPAAIAMLWQHRRDQTVGRWTHLKEDAQGLQVRGWVDDPRACDAIAAGLDGLSIGYVTRRQTRLASGGRRLAALDLIEISLTPWPMQPRARFKAHWPSRQAI